MYMTDIECDRIMQLLADEGGATLMEVALAGLLVLVIGVLMLLAVVPGA